jgi:hypothetical protein
MNLNQKHPRNKCLLRECQTPAIPALLQLATFAWLALWLPLAGLPSESVQPVDAQLVAMTDAPAP